MITKRRLLMDRLQLVGTKAEYIDIMRGISQIMRDAADLYEEYEALKQEVEQLRAMVGVQKTPPIQEDYIASSFGKPMHPRL